MTLKAAHELIGAQVLPPAAREALKRAAMTSTDHAPLARVRALEETIQRLRSQYPEFFRKED